MTSKTGNRTSKEDLRPEEIALHIANKVTAMLAYWDKDLVCRYANKAYSEWFGISGLEMAGKITLEQLLGPELFALNLPYIRNALDGKQQTFEREIRTPAGVVKHSLATYYPDIENGIVKGLVVHVAETSLIRKMEEEKKREILRSVIETQENEREVISNRIHEQTMQTLSSCKLILEDLMVRGADSSQLKLISRNLQTAIEELKHTCDTLTPLTILDLGLKEALKENFRNLRKRHRVRLRILRFDKQAESTVPAENLNIFRIVSDLSNIIAKYGEAKSIEIGLYYNSPVLRLIVQYAGKPFDDLSGIRELRNVRNRIEFYNGSLESNSDGSSRTVEIKFARSGA